MSQQIKYPFSHLADVNAPYHDEIAAALLRVLNSGYYIGGPEVATFEQTLAQTMQAPFAVGVSNGLDALRLIFRAYIELGKLQPGDEVIVPANTYVASILAVTDNNLTPVFVEPNPITLNLDSAKVESAISPRTRAVLPVHLYGRVCWDENLRNIALQHNLIVVEDNAQAIGAQAPCNGLFSSRKTGALGHAGAFSFYPTKNIGALGDAGAVVTHDSQLADAVRALRNYGSDRQYHNIYKGLNCRLDPMQAAVLTIKLKHLQQENQYRRTIAQIYEQHITNPRITKPQWLADNQHVWHQYIIRVTTTIASATCAPLPLTESSATCASTPLTESVDTCAPRSRTETSATCAPRSRTETSATCAPRSHTESVGAEANSSKQRDAFRDYLLQNGVETAVHYATPPHRQPCYRQYSQLSLPITTEIANTVVSLPITRTTTPDDARAIAAIINRWH